MKSSGFKQKKNSESSDEENEGFVLTEVLSDPNGPGQNAVEYGPSQKEETENIVNLGNEVSPQDLRKQAIEEELDQWFPNDQWFVGKENLREAYLKIALFLDDRDRVKARLLELDEEIAEWMRRPEEHRGLSAIMSYLEDFERQNGFNADVLTGTDNEVYGTGPAGIYGVLTPKLFLWLLKHGVTWNDPTVEGDHGALTHRIQWYAIIKEWQSMALDTLTPVEAYKNIAEYLKDNPLNKNEVSLWDYLVDKLTGDSYRRPENLSKGITEAGYPKLRQAIEDHQKWFQIYKHFTFAAKYLYMNTPPPPGFESFKFSLGKGFRSQIIYFTPRND